MNEGILGHLFDAVAVQEFAGCDFDTAIEIVKAANEPVAEPEPPTATGNVIYGVDFTAGRWIDHDQLA
jgi:hypothetical protein